MKIIYLIVASLLLTACNKEKKESQKEEIKKEKGSYISQKWKQTKEIFTESDSVLSLNKEKYFAHLRTFYPEYKRVELWFKSNPKECLGQKGEFYKMLKNEIDNNKTISHNDLAAASELNTYKYLLVTEGAYYIYDLAIVDNRCKYKGVRRIKKGYGSEAVHDLIFDKKGELSKELYQGDVKQDLFTKDGHLYFQFEKDSKGQNVKNTIDLGKERNF